MIKDGGAISTEFRDPLCFVAIVNCYAFKNIGFFAGFFNIESTNSKVVIRDCICESNIGFDVGLSAGGGSVIMVKGDPTTKLFSYNNLYFNSGTSLRGIYFSNICLI